MSPLSVLTALALLPLQPQQIPATRADLAEAYIAFERAWAEHRPQDPAEIERYNREVDAVAISFFSGRNDVVVGAFRRLEDELCGRWPRSETAFALGRVRMEAHPPIADETAREGVRLDLGWSLSPEQRPEAAALLVVLGPDGGALAHRSLDLSSAPQEARLQVARDVLRDAAPGRCTVELRLDGQRRGLGGFWNFRSGLDATRESLLARLTALADGWSEAQRTALDDARASARARCGLLEDRPGAAESARYLLDPVELAREVEEEVAALERGEDPYRGRTGRSWRVARLGSGVLPYGLYVPTAAREGEPLPLLIAFHGAGGDENMFLDAYGAGILMRLAEEHGFVLVTPRSGLPAANPRLFDELLASLGADYAVDLDRVYLLGHSMGTGPTAAFSRRFRDRVAASCCMAGAFSLNARDPLPPLLLVAGAVDAIVPALGVQRAFEKAREQGAEVTLWMRPESGHTLIVGDLMPAVIDWLLQHRRSGAEPSEDGGAGS